MLQLSPAMQFALDSAASASILLAVSLFVWSARQVMKETHEIHIEDKDDPGPADTISVASSSKTEHLYPCGHNGAQEFTLSIYGAKTGPIIGNSLCPQCTTDFWKQFVIPCERCGLPIMPGDAVAIYEDNSEDHKELGCLRWDCCESIRYYRGHWTGTKIKRLFLSGSTIAPEVRQSKQTLFLADRVGSL